MDLRLFQLPQTVVKHLGELCVQCLRTVRRASAPWQRRGACLRSQTVRSDWAGLVLSGLNLAGIKKPFAAFVQLNASRHELNEACEIEARMQVEFCRKHVTLFFRENTPQPKWQVWAQEELGDEFVLNGQLLIYSGCYPAKADSNYETKSTVTFLVEEKWRGLFPSQHKV